jgi:hypothetical protein
MAADTPRLDADTPHPLETAAPRGVGGVGGVGGGLFSKDTDEQVLAAATKKAAKLSDAAAKLSRRAEAETYDRLYGSKVYESLGATYVALLLAPRPAPATTPQELGIELTSRVAMFYMLHMWLVRFVQGEQASKNRHPLFDKGMRGVIESCAASTKLVAIALRDVVLFRDKASLGLLGTFSGRLKSVFVDSDGALRPDVRAVPCSDLLVFLVGAAGRAAGAASDPRQGWLPSFKVAAEEIGASLGLHITADNTIDGMTYPSSV